MAFINLRLDLFWHKKEAAASTVCLKGFPCHFFCFMLLLIKLGFMAAYAVILFEDSSSTLWIRPLFFFVVVLSTVSGQIRLPQLQEIRLHCFCVDSSTVAYKAWLYGFYQFTFRFILA